MVSGVVRAVFDAVLQDEYMVSSSMNTAVRTIYGDKPSPKSD